MIVFNKNSVHNRSPDISRPVSKDRRRVRATKAITKKNKIFLRSLGFKI
jgi:hypothetical protein